MRASVTAVMLLVGASTMAFAADELVMADGKKKECEVMMYQAGKFLVYTPDGKREIISVSDIKSGEFEPPDELMNMVKLSSGQVAKFLVRGYGDEGFDAIMNNGDEKFFPPDQVAAIKFRSSTSYTGQAAAGKAGAKPGGKPDPAAAKRITDDQIPEMHDTLKMNVPSKVIDRFVELLEMNEELEVLKADLSGSRSIENKIKKLEEEMKGQEGEIGGYLGKEVSKTRERINKMKEQVERLDARFAAASEKNRDADAIFEEKLAVVAEQKELQTTVDAFYWSFTGALGDKPPRDGVHSKRGRGVPSAAVYQFGKGHTRLDKKTIKGLKVLCFWSSQNRESQKAIKLMEQLLTRFPAGELEVYTINVGDNLATLKTLVPKLPRMKGMYHTIDVKDGEKSMVTHYGVTLLPTFVVIDPGGKINSAQVGYSSKWGKFFEQKLKAMVEPDDPFAK